MGRAPRNKRSAVRYLQQMWKVGMGVNDGLETNGVQSVTCNSTRVINPLALVDTSKQTECSPLPATPTDAFRTRAGSLPRNKRSAVRYLQHAVGNLVPGAACTSKQTECSPLPATHRRSTALGRPIKARNKRSAVRYLQPHGAPNLGSRLAPRNKRSAVRYLQPCNAQGIYRPE